jgi:hypothetical protein
MIQISKLAFQQYAGIWGRTIIKMLPGQIQSPLGTCALTSILPYLKAKLLVILAENIGSTMSFAEDLQHKI